MTEKAERSFSSQIARGIALLGGFSPRKTRLLKCKLPAGANGPELAIAVCRTWAGEEYYIFEKGGRAYIDVERIMEEWPLLDVFHRKAVAELKRQAAIYGEALIALNEEDNPTPKMLLAVAPSDEGMWEVVKSISFKNAGLI